MTPDQLRALYNQRQQRPVRQGMRPLGMPPSPLPKSGPVHNVKPHVQTKTTGGCCGRRWRG
ncbi:hypothetical protein AAFJ72_06945 [Brevibacillus gelatini]|uniref:hypothetical protein n=1 Tax=Brevibacillus gelatini TaxID=1655277 RepID=UPI003D81AF17